MNEENKNNLQHNVFTFERSTKRKKEEKHINSIETENNLY